MTMHAPVQASPPVEAPPAELNFAARLALLDADMADRLNEASVAFNVNTAHIPSAEPVPKITETLPLTPPLAPALTPYSTPIAATLHRAGIRLETDGWCTGALRDQQGARCLIGHIRAEAASRYEADDACVLLLEAIRRDFPDAETIPSWQDAQRDPRLPARYLDRAATLAHARLI